MKSFAWVGLLTIALVGCTEWGRNPAFPEGNAPTPLLVTSALKCPGEANSNGFVMASTAEYESAAIALEGAVAARVGGHASIDGSSVLECGAVATNYPHYDSWDAPALSAAAREIVRGAGARSVLVPVVWSKYTCTLDSTGSGGWRARTGTSRCYEESLYVMAFLFADDGKLLWRGADTFRGGSWLLTKSKPRDYASGSARMLRPLPAP